MTGQKNKPVFDEKKALGICDNDEEMLHEILGAFQIDGPAYMQKLEASLADGDVVMAQKYAHALKGASGAICAEAMQDAARLVEMAARGRDLEQARRLFQNLSGEHEKLKTLLTKKLAS